MFMLLCIFSACRAPEQAAQRHLAKAIRLDPNIIQKRILDTLIKGVASGQTTIITPATSSDIKFPCDSLVEVLEKLKASGQKDPVVKLYADSAKSIEVLKKGDNLYARFKTPSDTIIKNVNVPYFVRIKVPAEKIIQYKDAPVWSYWWFWILVALNLFFIYLMFSKFIRDRGAVIKEIYADAKSKL